MSEKKTPSPEEIKQIEKKLQQDLQEAKRYRRKYVCTRKD